MRVSGLGLRLCEGLKSGTEHFCLLLYSLNSATWMHRETGDMLRTLLRWDPLIVDT